MKRNIFLMLLLIVFLASCSTTQKAPTNIRTGEHYMAMGQYNEALNYFENNIQEIELKGKTISGEIYRKAGEAAFKLENTNKAISYFEKAANLKVETGEMLIMQAACYRKIDNLSKEIIVIENYIAKYPSGKDINAAKLRLFETCLESENWILAEDLWSGFGLEAENNSQLMDVYLKVNIALKNEKKSDGLAEKLFKLDANNITALERIAEKYFWKAESRYQQETKAYENKKTRSQYVKLLKALDVVTADFKKSLGYFESLYNIKPEKIYAQYLGNIYARLDDKKKSTYYKNRAR